MSAIRRTLLAGAALLLAAAPAFAADEKPKPEKVGPPKNVELPIPVSVRVWVNGISKIDEVEGSFAAEIDVWLGWHDPRLAFDAAAIGLDRQEFGFDESGAKLANMWTPDVSVANMDKGPTEDRTGIIIDSKGNVQMLRRLNARFKSALVFDRFPFDSQSLVVDLRSPRYPASQIVFTQGVAERQASGMNSDVVIPNWRFDRSLGFHVGARRGWTGRDHSEAEISITARRDAGQYIFQVFLPFFTIMMFPPLALWAPKVDVTPRANMVFSGIFSLIALSYSIFVRYPMLAAVDNVIVSMLWIGYLYLAGVLTLIMTIHNPSFTGRFPGKHVWAEAQAYTTWSVPILFVLAITATIVRSM